MLFYIIDFYDVANQVKELRDLKVSQFCEISLCKETARPVSNYGNCEAQSENWIIRRFSWVFYSAEAPARMEMILLSLIRDVKFLIKGRRVGADLS